MRTDSPAKQTGKNHHFRQALRHSWGGICWAVRAERNMRLHLLAAGLALIGGLWLGLSRQEWLWIVLAIFAVWGAEFANTVVEALVDLMVGHHYELAAKRAKDVAAGGVLLAALFAVIVGLLILGPRLLAKF